MARKQKVTWICVLAGVLLLIMSGVLWYTKIYPNPTRTFWATLDNSLATSAVTRSVTDSLGQDQENTMTTLLWLGGKNQSHIVQSQGSSAGNTVTEYMTTPNASYVRFTDINLAEPLTAEQRAKVLNVWAKIPRADDTAVSSYFSSSFASYLPGFPIANLDHDDRAELVEFARSQKVFTITGSKQQSRDGRLERVYSVKVNVVPYVSFLKLLGEKTGLHDYEQVDASSYAGQEIPPLTITIDVYGRHMVNVEASGISETYKSYGVTDSVALPADKDTITSEELTKRLQALQG